MTYLFVDTETTGFPIKGALIQPDQARVCQVAMILTDKDGKPMAEFSSLIKPAGWEVSSGAANVHGITTEMCQQYGVFDHIAYGIFRDMANVAETIIAHNANFDKWMLDIEREYIGDSKHEDKWVCTMEMSKEICKIPPTEKMKAAGIEGFKNPKLSEALKAVCDRDLGDDAHDARYDTIACRDIFFALKKAEQQDNEKEEDVPLF